jgi:cyclophilin family peptidyl-prolyl cis-trans isomerase
MIAKRNAALIASGLVSLALFPLLACSSGASPAATDSQSAVTRSREAEPEGTLASASLSKQDSGEKEGKQERGDDGKKKRKKRKQENGSDEKQAPNPLKRIHKFIGSANVDKTKADWRTHLPKPPKLPFGKKQVVKWNLATSEGLIVVQLMPDVAPMHVSSTMYLTELGFYDGLTFHRVIPGFMAQGGDPLGTGSGSPGYEYGGEFSKRVRFDRPGLLAMANRGPNTDGSQFFLTLQPTSWLNDKHTIFGEVVEGMDVLKKLEAAGTESGRPTKKLTIDKATVTVE